MIPIYTCSFKGIARKYLGHRFKNYQHRKRHSMNRCKKLCIFFATELVFYADKSILRAVIWLVLLMHASYSNHIEYNETPTLPVLNGPPSWVVRSASKKRPIRSSIQTVYQVNLAIRIPNITEKYIISHVFTFRHWVSANAY